MEMTLSLPRSLLRLFLHETRIASSLLSCLPPNLQVLNYKQSSIPHIEPEYSWRGEDFIHLPRSLHTLYLHAATEVEEQHLALLPPHLKRFHFELAPKLTKTALQFLPIHCELGLYGYDALTEAYTSMQMRMSQSHLHDPDPRVIGLPYPWPN